MKQKRRARISFSKSEGVAVEAPDALRAILMYVILPLWLAAGFADYLCHRASRIEITSGWRESLLHLAQFAEVALPILAALFFDINAGIILLMIICLFLHQITAMWDVRYATATREVKPIEQHVHSVLEMMPLTALLMIIALNMDAFFSLLRWSNAQFALVPKVDPLPWTYLAIVLGATALFEVLPYLEELVRGARGRGATRVREPRASTSD
jgi:hypothetical protein